MKDIPPLVSIVCLCHNQRAFVKDCLQSLIDQTYSNVQIVIVDDGSSDGSKQLIEEITDTWTQANSDRSTFINLEQKLGNCRAFNLGLSACKGEFVIDLAMDDVMRTDRLEEQVSHFMSLDDSFGVVYTDAEYIDSKGVLQELHRVSRPAEGSVYAEVVKRYFIPPPTMMMRRSLLSQLGGYDEQLAYEDFDFWVRSARLCQYAYLPKPLTKIRRVSGSLSTKFYEPNSPLAQSTYEVCLKVFELNETSTEHEALAVRIRYERRQCALLGNRALAKQYGDLLRKVTTWKWEDAVVDLVILLPWNWRLLLRTRHFFSGERR